MRLRRDGQYENNMIFINKYLLTVVITYLSSAVPPRLSPLLQHISIFVVSVNDKPITSMGKKDDGNDDDDDDDIAINCDGNGAVILVLLSHRRRSCWREY